MFASLCRPKQRELISVSCLAGQVVFPQLHSHLLGALNAGASLAEVRGILDQTELAWGAENQSMVRCRRGSEVTNGALTVRADRRVLARLHDPGGEAQLRHLSGQQRCTSLR